jgi:RNA polymerase sigma factor (sigma-70 family)
VTNKKLGPMDGAIGTEREVADFSKSSLPNYSAGRARSQCPDKQNRDEIQALIRRFQFSDDAAISRDALNRLCAIHRRTVEAGVRRWWPAGAGKRVVASRDQEAWHDLLQAAWVGFVKACDRYKSQFGASLATYARWWICDELRQTSRKHIQWCRNSSLNDRVGEHKDGDQLIDLLADRNTPSPEAALLTRQTAQLVDAALAMIDGRARRILLARFSVGPLSYAEIAVEIGISSERVRQIEEKARGKIKRHLERSLGGEVPTIVDDKQSPEGCHRVRSNGGCDLADAIEPAQITLKTGKLRKVSRAKAASDVRKIKVTPALTAFYLAPLQIAIKHWRRPFFERTIDSPGAAKIFPLPSDRRMARR